MGTLAGLFRALLLLLLATGAVAVLAACGSDDEVTPGATHTLSMYIQFGPDDAQWFRDVKVPQGFDAYQVTEQVTGGELESQYFASLRAHFVESIMGVANEGSNFWLFYIWSDFEEAWEPSPVGADLLSVKDGHNLAWVLTDTDLDPAPLPAGVP